MPAQATIDAEIADLKARLVYEPNLDVQQAAQDRIDQLKTTSGQAPVYGVAAGITKGKGKK